MKKKSSLDLQKFDLLLKKDIEMGYVRIEEHELKDIEDKEYYS